MPLRVIPRIYQIFEICENENSFLKWSGKSFQVLAAKYIMNLTHKYVPCCLYPLELPRLLVPTLHKNNYVGGFELDHVNRLDPAD